MLHVGSHHGHYVHPHHAVFVEDEYPIRGVVTQVLDATTLEVRVHAASKWLLPFGPGGTPLALVLSVDSHVPPIRYQTRKIEEVGKDDAFVLKITHTIRPVFCFKDDDQECTIDDAAERVRVLHADVELIGLIDEPIKPAVEQAPTEVLQTLAEYTELYGAMGDDGDAGGPPADDGVPPLTCFEILETGLSHHENPVGLSENSTPTQLKDAITALMSFMATLEAKGRLYEILGNTTASAVRRTTDFQRTLLRLQLAYGSALALANLRAAQCKDYDVTRVNYGGYSVVEGAALAAGPGQGGRKGPRGPKPEVDLMDKMLQYCALNALRHVKAVVYIEQCVPEALNVRWRPAKCTVCGEYSMAVMYARKDTREALCATHALEAVDQRDEFLNIENVVFRCAASFGSNPPPDLRMATAGKPKWLIEKWPSGTVTSTKTWVPDMGVGAEASDVMGADQPETTKDLVRRVMDRRMFDRDMWATFVGNRGITDHLANHLAQSIDPAFPVHKPKTQLFSFVNGLYSVADNRFRFMDKIPSQWAKGGAINFIPEFFDPLWTVQPLDTLGVPGYDEILKTQGYAADTVRFLDAFLGRQLFKLGDRDTWQLAPVLLGTAGSGKSTIAKALMMLVREQNVGQLPSNCEEQYAVASLVGKVMVMCTEMKEGFKLPISVLQCMITGDPVSVHAKFKDVFDKASWDSHCLLVGNVIPFSWRADAGGAMERRVVVFRMDTKPATQDPTIQTRFFQNLGPFLVRITRAYKQLTDTVRDAAPQGKFIKDFVPRQVAAFHAMFKSETSISAAFLDFLLLTFDIGCMNAQPPIVLDQDKDLMELYRFMQDAQANGVKRFHTVRSGQEKIQRQMEAAVVGTRLPLAACHDMVKEYRVPVKELETMYQGWWKDTNPGGKGPGGSKAPPLHTIMEDIGLVVTTDAEARPSTQRFVYGLRRRPDDGDLLAAMM